VTVLYLIGLCGEVFMLTAIYFVMPVGRLSVRHALIGGVTAALLWELTRRVLVWYFGTLSFVTVVYDSLARPLSPCSRSNQGAGFPAVYCPTEYEAERVLRLLNPEKPKVIRKD
jgi:membrane protein